MKKALPLTLVLIGAALLITAVVFWIDSSTTGDSQSLGQSLRDWITLVAGLGASIKGWVDLLKKDQPAPPTTQIIIKGGTANIVTGENAQDIRTKKHIENQMLENDVEQKYGNLVEIRPVLRHLVADSLREQDIREIISDYFPLVELNLSSRNSTREAIGELVDYAISQGKVEYLIEIISKLNPYQYNKHKKELARYILILKDKEK